MRSNLLLLPTAFTLAFFPAACAPPVQPATRPSVVSENLSDVRMPVLRSPYFEKNWGKPDIEVMSDGTYQLRYRQGTTLNFVMIRSLTKMEPTPANPPDWKEASENPDIIAPTAHKQSWKHTNILGKPVKWYQRDGGGGADFPAYRTEDFSLTSPDGRTGYYRISVDSDAESKTADWINRVGW